MNEKRAAEMPGCGRRWKTQKQVFQRRPRALGNRRRDSHIPAAPDATTVGKWKSKCRIPTFPRLIPLSQNQKRKENSIPTCYPRLQAHLRIRKRYDSTPRNWTLRIHIQRYINRVSQLIGNELRISFQLPHERCVRSPHDLKVAPAEADSFQLWQHRTPPTIVF